MKIKIPSLNIPGPLKLLIKIVISAAIIFLVVRKIDEQLLIEVVRQANIWWILWALFWFVLSKIIAAFRFNHLLKTESINLSTRKNLRLYWLCMYYNLLLPGGISGDGYKMKVLMDWFNRPFKRIFAITLIDRLSGLIALGQLGIIFLLWIPEMQKFWALTVVAFLLSIVVGWGIFKWAGGQLSSAWIITSIQSIGVQGSQAVATLGLVIALGQGAHWTGYLILFLVSSLVAMIPITIGGAGARELTFMYGAQFLDIQIEKAVAIAFLFYLISSVVSFFGIIYSFKRDKVDTE